jgi:hypothetical protein
MVTTETFLTDNVILIKPETARRNGCIVSRSGVSVNSDGEYVIKAGTPLYGTDVGLNRETALTIAAVGSGDSATKPQGVLYQDVKFVGTSTKANGVIVIDGEVDYNKLDSTVQALITSTVKTALTNIQFTKGRAD